MPGQASVPGSTASTLGAHYRRGCTTGGKAPQRAARAPAFPRTMDVANFSTNREVYVRRNSFIIATFLAALCLCRSAQAAPAAPGGITLFRTDVTVLDNGTLEVVEEIAVNDAASFYKYGFRRVLPISSEDRWDPRYAGEYKQDNGIRVRILEVLEDRKPVKYEQGSGYGYPQLLIGAQDVPFDSGKHRFVIRYMVDSALNLGGARDMLYWNANGHGHEAPIAEAILSIRLPRDIPGDSIAVDPRVAGRGVSNPRQPETSLDRLDHGNGPIVYRAMNVGPRQSLSLAVSWPSGYIRTPQLQSLRRDGWVFAAPGLLFLYYLIAWIWIGPEPKPGTMVARYEPPEGMSPAAARYIAHGTTDGRSFAAVIAQLAVRGCLRVESDNGKYKLSRLMSDRATESALAPEEKRVLAELFTDGPAIELSGAMDQRNTAQNGRYVFDIHNELTKDLAGKYFTRHSGFIALGVLATFGFALPLAITARGRDASAAFFFTIWVLFCGLIVGMMIELSLASAWKAAVKTGTGWTKLLPATAAIAVFGGAIGLLLKNLASGVSLSFSLMLVAFLLINLGWGPRLKRKTPLGREMSNQIAGFRQFLEKVDQDKLDRLNPGSNTPEDLDRFLPYAIALEVKEAWGDHLSQTFFASTVIVEN
jgi:hypothetical protein